MKSQHIYFPVNDAQREWGLYATCVGHSVTNPGDAFPSENHPDEYFFTWDIGRTIHEWQISIIQHGHGTFEFDNRRYSAREGSLIVVPPERWHRFRPAKASGWTTLWIGFGGDFAERLVRGAGLNPMGEVRDVSDAMGFRRLFASTVANILEHDFENVYSAAARIHLLLASLMSERNLKPGGASRQELVHLAQRHIIEHAAEIVDFAELAKSLGVPYRTFRHLFTKATGTSLLQYQLEIRLARAKSLLKSTDMPISEVARATGFKSTWYFAHFFQTHVRMSPGSYRKRQTPHRTQASQ